MIRRNQLIAAVLATAFAGVGSAMACGTCGGAGYGYRSFGGYGGGYGYGYRGFGGYRTFANAGYFPTPVGEFYTTRTFRQRPLCATRVVRVIRPAPVAQLVTTRRVIVRRSLAPVAECIPNRTFYRTGLAPVGERIITRRADWGYRGANWGYRGNSFGRVVTAPFRFVGNTVTWPFRRAFQRTQPEIVGERILVTRVATYPGKRTHIKRHHAKHKSMHHGKRHAKYSKRLAPVGERVVNMKCTIQ